MNPPPPKHALESRHGFHEISHQVHQARYFSFPAREAGSAPVAIAYGGLEICDPTYRIERESFPLHTLEVVLSGSGELHLSDGLRTLSPGSVFLYGPQLPCRIVNHPSASLRKYFISFSSGVPDLLEHFALQHTQFSQSSADDGLLPLAEMLFAEGCSAHPGAFGICNQILVLMLMCFARSTTLAHHREEPGWTVFCRCRSLLDERFLELRKLDELAALLDLSPSYISRLFKRYHHTSPYQYLQRRKLSFAESLLREEGLSVARAAERAGFDDPFHFSRAFKRYKGFSPSRFRRNH